jgi:hypothetical protein
MKQERFPAMSQLLGAYFHQDWMLLNSDGAEVVRSIVAETSPDYLSQAAHEIDELLDLRLTEDELAQLFYPELGIYFIPSVDGISYSDWLRSVRDAFRVGGE